MNIRHLDLNLLVVFDAIMRTESLTLAAERLGQAQPTVSHALNRLRDKVGDPLFVRTRNRFQPTPYALALSNAVLPALEMLQEGLNRKPQFDPASSNLNFKLLMSDLGQAGLLPALVRRLDQTAPGITLVCAQVPRSEYAEALQSGRADLAIGSLHALQAGFYQRRLFDDHLVCVVCARNKAIGDVMSVEQYVAARHVGIISPGFSELEVDHLALPMARTRRIAVSVPHFLAAPGLVAGTSLVVTVPSRAMQIIAMQADLKLVSLAIDPPPSITVRQYWHERSHHDEAHQWLRQVIAELFLDRLSPAT
jgi:DNA-binding transcriptional LysR family regulator